MFTGNRNFHPNAAKHNRVSAVRGHCSGIHTHSLDFKTQQMKDFPLGFKTELPYLGVPKALLTTARTERNILGGLDLETQNVPELRFPHPGPVSTLVLTSHLQVVQYQSLM